MTRPSKWIESIPLGAPVSDAARASLEARLGAVAHWLPLAARHVDDIENVHQLRVATRRAIAALRLYRDWLPQRKFKWLVNRLKELRRAAGDARDLDVLAAWARQEVGYVGSGVVVLIAAARAEAQPAIMAVAERCEQQHRFCREACQAQADVRPRGVQRSARDIDFSRWAQGRLELAAEEFFGAPHDASGQLPELHAFRIRGKALRYTLELLEPAYGARLRDGVYPTVEQLQELLGQVNDCVHADARLRRLQPLLLDLRERSLVERLIAAQRERMDDALGEFRGWWTAERAAELRQGLAALATTCSAANEKAQEAAAESAFPQL